MAVLNSSVHKQKQDRALRLAVFVDSRLEAMASQNKTEVKIGEGLANEIARLLQYFALQSPTPPPSGAQEKEPEVKP